MNIQDFSGKNWQIQHDNFSWIFQCENFDQIKADLSEDLLQMENGRYIIDIGWYAGVEAFILFYIENEDWERPVMRYSSANINEICAELRRILSVIDTHSLSKTEK
ncbi:hypothetical protein [Capnocytophaga sp.]|uniref:hypothetical protein n=1 Tax=Capnocytophaga sp. TaxID=44737 RepID=UPI0026DAC22E|nr:hypothetical protein [Capnocytophaga sp.]MDO5105929.1 hypothetical protein [Capnocytophaga sp.]